MIPSIIIMVAVAGLGSAFVVSPFDFSRRPVIGAVMHTNNYEYACCTGMSGGYIPNVWYSRYHTVGTSSRGSMVSIGSFEEEFFI